MIEMNHQTTAIMYKYSIHKYLLFWKNEFDIRPHIFISWITWILGLPIESFHIGNRKKTQQIGKVKQYRYIP